MSGRLLLRLATLALGLSLSSIIVATAAAHAELRRAVPEPGAVLNASPDEIRLTFNEPLGTASTFIVYNRAFEAIAGIKPEVVAGIEKQLAANVPPLPAGVYTVQWNVVGIDGHPSGGSYSFEVLASRISAGRPWPPALAILAIIAVTTTILLLRRARPGRQR